MDSETNKYHQMVCLVGENPLPIYLCIKQFAEKGATIILVCSTETRPHAGAIMRIFQQEYRFTINTLDNAFDPHVVDDRMRDIYKTFPNALLNYSGGSKVMSGFSLSHWKAASPERIVYLEEAGKLFHFGDKAVGIPLSVNLTLNQLKKLHEPDRFVDGSRECLDPTELIRVFHEVKRIYNTDGAKSFFYGGEPTYEDITDIKNKAHRDFQTFRSWLTHNQASWLQEPEPMTYKEYRGSRFECLVKCAAGGWFEQLMEQIVRSLPQDPNLKPAFTGILPEAPLVPNENVLANQRFFMGEERRWDHIGEFESDLLVVHAHGLRYISVTTSDSFKTCKSKMFEAKYRAEQIGGGLASSCVVCLGNRVKRFSLVEAARTALGNDPRHTIFGIGDVEKWLNGETKTLRAFLTR